MIAFSPTTTLEDRANYLCQDVVYGACIDTARPWLLSGAVRPEPMPAMPPRLQDVWGQAAELKTIGVMRAGGIGDLLFITPTLKRVLELCPNATIELSVLPPYACLFEGWERVKTVPYPLILKTASRWDAFLNLLKIIDHAHDTHAVDAFAQAAGVKLGSKRTIYHPFADEVEAMAERFPRQPGVMRLGWQCSASQKLRTYPLDQQIEVWHLLLSKYPNLEIYLFGQAGEHRFPFKLPDRVMSLAMLDQAPSLRESAAILLGCDAFCGPDSGVLHLAGALGVPGVGLFGPIPWQLRAGPDVAPTLFCINGVADCAPCHHHTGGFPDHGPCAKSGKCEALAWIKPEMVARRLEMALLKAHKRNSETVP